jgi:hypothetical protein
LQGPVLMPVTGCCRIFGLFMKRSFCFWP